MKPETKRQLEEFFGRTREIFSYLEDKFAYRLNGSDIDDPADPEMLAYVRYVGSRVGVGVYYSPASAVIDAILVSLLVAGEFPDKVRYWGRSTGEAAGIKLHTLADLLGKRELYLLPNPRSNKVADIRKRRQILRAQMPAVLENVSSVLQSVAPRIIEGDTTFFEQVRQHEEELLRAESPEWFGPGAAT